MKSTLPRIKLLKEAWCFVVKDWLVSGNGYTPTTRPKWFFSKFPKSKFVLKQPSESKCLNECELNCHLLVIYLGSR